MSNIKTLDPKLQVVYHIIKHIVSGDYSFADECITINDWAYTGCPVKLTTQVEELGCGLASLSHDDEWVLEVYAK